MQSPRFTHRNEEQIIPVIKPKTPKKTAIIQYGSCHHNLHQCGDYLCNSKGVLVAAHQIGLKEDYGTEFAIAAFVTKLASFGLDALVPVVGPSSPSLEPEPGTRA